jgi:hypothetical protein
MPGTARGPLGVLRPQDDDEFFAEMIAQRRLVNRLGLERVHGVIVSGGRRPSLGTRSAS